ncbi:hypothetical protein ZIOFF_047759 [Zingiber officinale]|uniref:Uncharacterized protein n=1 Tax=Zingiber officinale TaxID=94328 RepID=A0A8J5FYI1_ZINOF|nr:hypothetical protein ZIOFF_047759 [Zingiber officinale]
MTKLAHCIAPPLSSWAHEIAAALHIIFEKDVHAWPFIGYFEQIVNGLLLSYKVGPLPIDLFTFIFPVISKEVPLRCLFELHGFSEQCELQDLIQFRFPAGKYLVARVVDGRNIRANDFASSLSTLAGLEAIVGKGRIDKLVVSTSCTRLSTLSTRQIKLDSEIKGMLLWLKSYQVNALAKVLAGEKDEVVLTTKVIHASSMISEKEYVLKAIKEELNIDVLVHGEPEDQHSVRQIIQSFRCAGNAFKGPHDIFHVLAIHLGFDMKQSLIVSFNGIWLLFLSNHFQTAVYGVGVEFGSSLVHPLVGEVLLISLNNVIGHSDALQSDNVMTYDNIVSVLGKICQFHRDGSDAAKGEVVGSGLGGAEGGGGWRQHHAI